MSYFVTTAVCLFVQFYIPKCELSHTVNLDIESYHKTRTWYLSGESGVLHVTIDARLAESKYCLSNYQLANSTVENIKNVHGSTKIYRGSKFHPDLNRFILFSDENKNTIATIFETKTWEKIESIQLQRNIFAESCVIDKSDNIFYSGDKCNLVKIELSNKNASSNIRIDKMMPKNIKIDPGKCDISNLQSSSELNTVFFSLDSKTLSGVKHPLSMERFDSKDCYVASYSVGSNDITGMWKIIDCKIEPFSVLESISFTPDAKYCVADISNYKNYNSSDSSGTILREVKLYDTTKGLFVNTHTFDDNTWAIRFDNTNKYLIAIGNSDTKLNAKKHTEVWILNINNNIQVSMKYDAFPVGGALISQDCTSILLHNKEKNKQQLVRLDLPKDYSKK